VKGGLTNDHSQTEGAGPRAGRGDRRSLARPAYAQAPASKARININTAPASELENLPRIGPKVAQRIIDFRTKNGNFKKVEEIMKVQGIGEKVFEQIKELITVGAATAPD